MSDFVRIFATILLAANPLMVAAATGWRPAAMIAGPSAAAAGVMLVFAGVIAEPLLDALSIEPETFRVGAGAIVLVTGAAALLPLGPRAIPAPASGAKGFALIPAVFPMAWPGLASAGAVAAAMSYSANGEMPATLAAIVVAMAVSAGAVFALGGRWRLPVLAVGRIGGAVLIVLAIDLIVSGIKVV